MTQVKKAPTKDELEKAYEVLLCAPLSRFAGGAYATYVWSDYLQSSIDWTAATLKKMAMPLKPRSAIKGDLASPRGIDWDRFDLDLAQSIFLIHDVGVAAKKVLEPFAKGSRGLSGQSLAAALAAKKLGAKALADEAGEFFIPVVGRVVTDGTLRDAMAAATWTASAPRGLLRPEPQVEVDPAWEQRLKTLVDPKVRAHFGCLCQTPNGSRSSGATFLGKRWPSRFEVVKALGHKVLAGWELGEGQGSIAVVRL